MSSIVILSALATVGALLLIQTKARRQLHIATPTGKTQAGNIVENHFDEHWKNVSGPGTFNYQPRLREHAPTISITVSGNDACSTVTIWTSRYDWSYHGMCHAALMVRTQHTLTKKLTSEQVPIPGFLSANSHRVGTLPSL